MRILLDTHYLLWLMNEPEIVSAPVRRALMEADQVYFSAVSIWEIAIKSALRRADFSARPEIVGDAAVQAGMTALPLTWQNAALVADMPIHHRDPFDRLLIAQAMALPARLLTADVQLARYSELVWVVPA
jgi:PIN domain nuclease of toxin-antitoxin system